MKKITRRAGLAGLVVLTVLLAACHADHGISYDGRSVSMHADHAPTATILSNGSFSVGPKLIDTAPEQRQLLARYYQDVVTIHRGSEALRKAGFNLGKKALGMAGHSIERAVGAASASSAADKASARAMQDAGKDMQQKALHLCTVAEQARTLEATLASKIAAFQPYAGLDPAPGMHCDHSSK